MASIWLSHHLPGEEQRCVRLGNQLICRRCLVLWPATYLGIAVQIALHAPTRHTLDMALPVLLLPAVLEYVAVHLDHWRYEAWRVWALTPLLAIGLARLFYRVVMVPTDDFGWSVLLLTAVPCAWAAWRHHENRLAAPIPTLDDLPAPVQRALRLNATRSGSDEE